MLWECAVSGPQKLNSPLVKNLALFSLLGTASVLCNFRKGGEYENAMFYYEVYTVLILVENQALPAIQRS